MMTPDATHAVHARKASARTRSQVGRFLMIGVLTVLVDFSTYRVLLGVGMEISWAKAIGFVVGTAFAYFANRRWTFADSTPRRGSALRFALLYASTLVANVGVNMLVLLAAMRIVGPAIAVPVAFLCATGLSATLNFLGMKFLVFDHRP